MDKSYSQKSKGTLSIWGIVLGAIGASICCIGPLVLLALGIGGAWVGNLAAFEIYRPVFIVITLGFLGFAFYSVYRKPKAEKCAPGSYCEHPQSNRINKVSLWVVTVLALGLLSFPYVAPGLANAGQNVFVSEGSSQKVALKVNNMTCGACALTVQQSLITLDGVINAEVTFVPTQAVVTYDPKQIDVKDLINATTNAGYPSEPK